MAKRQPAGTVMLDEVLYNREQSWVYETIWAMQDRVAKVYIRRNAYDAQSWEEVALFDGSRWNVVLWRPIAEAVKDISYVQRELTQGQLTALQAETDLLLRKTVVILAAHSLGGVK